MPRALLVLGLLVGATCPACSTARVEVEDVLSAFRDDYRQLGLRLPQKEDLSPAHAADPQASMVETVSRASEYLAERPTGDSLRKRYVRALLAAALLIQGRNAEAKEAIEGIKPLRRKLLSRENAVISGVVYTVGACRALEARASLDRMFGGEMKVEEYLRRYASFVGIQLPPADWDAYESELRFAVQTVKVRCFAPEGAEGTALMARRRADMYGLTSGLAYDEAASLLIVLPDELVSAPEEWLATMVLALFVVYGELIPELLPQSLNPKQKEWHREHAWSAFDRVKRKAAHFLTEAERERVERSGRPREIASRKDFYRVLYARLLSAEDAVMAWISTR